MLGAQGTLTTTPPFFGSSVDCQYQLRRSAPTSKLSCGQPSLLSFASVSQRLKAFLPNPEQKHMTPWGTRHRAGLSTKQGQAFKTDSQTTGVRAGLVCKHGPRALQRNTAHTCVIGRNKLQER